MNTRFPGFIDVHVHLREPGSTHKEDFYSGSRAAIKGGFTQIFDMPNNTVPTFSENALDEKIRLAEKALCDVGFHFGTNGKNVDAFSTIWNSPRVFGLKIYCNHTTGEYLVDDPKLLEGVFAGWNSPKPILVHAEGEQLELAIYLAKKYSRFLHACHVSTYNEVNILRKEKSIYNSLSAGVTPHHLFLDNTSVENLGNYAQMKPALGSKNDQDALWEGLLDQTIDIVETDHAPHTKEEKNAKTIVYGVPGLETAVPLLSTAIHEGKMTQEQMKLWLYDNPKKIFHVNEQENTYVEIDLNQSYVVGENGYESKCSWSPFDGWKVFGKITTVVFRGREVVKEGSIIERSSV